MEPGDVLEGIHEIEKYDRMARRNFGLGDSTVGGSLSVLVLTNQAAVTVSRGFDIAKAPELGQRFAE